MNISVLGRIWLQKNYDEDFIYQLSKSLGISDLLARILSKRVNSVKEAVNFLTPRIKNELSDPMHLNDMDKAVERTIKAIKSNEKICIFADYDVDGATSSALIKNILRQINIRSEIYVPDRIKEGYGPNKNAIKKIRDSGVSLLIAVDCGTVAFDALDFATNIGLDVIVIDHHISLDQLPKAIAIVNPNRLDQDSNHKNLAAVGVSFLFMIALCSQLKAEKYFLNITPPNLLKQLDIVALGTVCDVMELRGLNRAFVYQGINIAKMRENVGFTTLVDLVTKEAITAYHFGFVIGPRINACGRVGEAHLGAELLSTDSKEDAIEIAQKLDKYNQERKEIERNTIDEAIRITEEDDYLIFISGENWHLGVIGIVAGRLKEKFNKPVAVISISNDIAKASCRSVTGVDFGCKILKAKQEGLILEGGGHAMAGGFTAQKSKLNDIKEFFKAEFAKDLSGANLHLTNYYDISVTTDSVNKVIMDEIESLTPFGIGNPEPIFSFSDLYVLRADIVGKGHIRVTFAPNKTSSSSKILNGIAFNAQNTPIGDILLSRKSHKIQVFGKIKINNWNNNYQLHVSDIRLEE